MPCWNYSNDRVALDRRCFSRLFDLNLKRFKNYRLKQARDTLANLTLVVYNVSLRCCFAVFRISTVKLSYDVFGTRRLLGLLFIS
jgi:hypothetical protein